MNRLLFVLLLLSASLFAQNATVVELSSGDAAQAQRLYQAKQAADAAWDSFNSRLDTTYKGFSGGIEFSEDFRFMVPKVAQQSGVFTINGCSFPTVNTWSSPMTSGTLLWDGSTITAGGGSGTITAGTTLEYPAPPIGFDTHQYHIH